MAAWLLLPDDEPVLPERMVLFLDLRDAIPETAGEEPLAALGLRRVVDTVDTLLALERAGEDPRVVGLLARLDGEGPGLAQAQELRDAVHRFRDSGRFALAFSDSFGEFGPGTQGYYLATAFEEIHLQPLGAVGLTGLMAEAPLLRGLLDNLGVEPVGGKRGVYKNAADVFTERELSPAFEEALEGLVDSLYGQIVAGIAADRGVDPATVGDLVDGAPYGAREALDLGLVDRLAFFDETVDLVEARAGVPAPLVPFEVYVATDVPEADDDAPVVALVHGVGQIQRGEGGRGPAGGFVMGADTVAQALSNAIEDPEVGAILFRIDSPGGSAVGSETIGREVRRAVAAGKPVIVSMAEVAASGGYWISMGASAITARPATLTGSIGVFAGKPVLRDLWDEIGVNWGRVQRGENADMWSTAVGFDEGGRERLESFLDRTYSAFIEGVAEGRGLTRDQVVDAAEGRVWTGEQARERQLIDGVGGFRSALTLARDAVGAGPDETLELRRYPRPRSPLDRILDLLERGPSLLAGLELYSLPKPPGVLTTPPLRIR